MNADVTNIYETQKNAMQIFITDHKQLLVHTRVITILI